MTDKPRVAPQTVLSHSQARESTVTVPAAGVAAVSPSEPQGEFCNCCGGDLTHEGHDKGCALADGFAAPEPACDHGNATSMPLSKCGMTDECCRANGIAPAVPPEPTPVGARDGWIPVSERLPDGEQGYWTDPVLLHYEDGTIAIDTYYHAFGQQRHGFWRNDQGYCKPNHWRPLPAPPNAADSRAPADHIANPGKMISVEAVEALKRDVLHAVDQYVDAMPSWLHKKIETLFDAAVKEPTT